MEKPRSKYQVKNYEETLYLMDEIKCPYCEKWFMADYTYFPTDIMDYDADFCRITCPYCGRRHHVKA